MKPSSILTWVALGILGFFLLSSLGGGQQQQQQSETWTYTQLIQTIETNPTSIKQIDITNGSNEVVVEPSAKDGKPAKVVLPAQGGEKSVLDSAKDHKVTVVAVQQSSSGWLSLLGWLPTIIMLGFLWFMMRGMMGGGGGNMLSKLGNSKVKVHMPGTPGSKTFADVAGCKEAKEELEEIVEYLREPVTFRQAGAVLPKGVLLVGPPGNGKTLLAKAVAGEANVPFFEMSGSDFVEIFVGKGASTARDLFDQARKNQPCIIFIDEIDAVGGHRGRGFGGGSDEKDQTLNQILVEMDGFTENDSIVLMAATNRPDILDPALTRSGRFDLQVTVEQPDLEGREAIFRIHMQGRPLAPDVDAKELARQTPGFSGADIASACNQAALMMRRRTRGAKAKGLLAKWRGATTPTSPEMLITMKDFNEAVDRVMGGPAKDRTMSEPQRKNTAVHEIGHAGVGHALKGAPIRKVTIMSRAKWLGFTLSYPEGDVYNKTRDEMLSEVASMMGGRVAQMEVLGAVGEDTGAANDFEQATKLARAMVTKFGMSSIGNVFISDESTGSMGRAGGGYSPSNWGPAVLDRVDVEVMKILGEATERARKVVREHRAAIDRVVACLLEKETILGDEFLKLWDEPTHECDCDDHGGNEQTSLEEPAASESDALKSSGGTETGNTTGDVGSGAASGESKDGEGSNKS